jgi:hypothetical protein
VKEGKRIEVFISRDPVTAAFIRLCLEQGARENQLYRLYTAIGAKWAWVPVPVPDSENLQLEYAPVRL